MRFTRAPNLAFAAAAALLLAGLWLACGIGSGYFVEAKLETLEAQATGQAQVRVVDLVHERGLLSSQGRMELRLDEPCATTPSQYAAVVDYQIAHALLPGSLARFEWTLRLTGRGRDERPVKLENADRLHGAGKVSLGGQLSSSIRLPEISILSAGTAFELAPLTGSISLGGKALGIDLNADRMVVRGGGQALELRTVQVRIDLRDRDRGIGRVGLTVEGVASSAVVVEGLAMLIDAVEHGDLVDVRMSTGMRFMQVAGVVARELGIEFAVRDLHAASVETIQRFARETCLTQNIALEERRTFRDALKTLLDRGLSVGITKVAGVVAGGSIEGELGLTLERMRNDGGLDLGSRLKASGRLHAKGMRLRPDQENLIIGLGLATKSPEGLVAGFDYADGMLKANGRVFDAEEVRKSVVALEHKINWMLDRLGGVTGDDPEQADSPGSATVRIFNRSTVEITEVRTAAKAEQDWGEDLLGNELVPPGGYFRLPRRGESECVFDVLVVYRNGSKEVRKDVDLCSITELAFGDKL